MVARRRRNPAVPRRRVRVGGCPVQTTVTARPGVARRWLYTTLWRQRHRRYSGSRLTVGMGVQWTPSFGRLPGGAEPRPGTLQICAGNRCLVFQLAEAGGAVPRILRRFLADGRVTFAAYNVQSDLRKLRAHHGLEVESALELRGAAGMGNASMADMADTLLGIRSGVEKSWKVGTSEWDGPRLSREQVRYAAVDAYLSCRLGVYIRRRAAAAAAVMMAAQESEGEYDSDEDEEYVGREVSPEPACYDDRGGGWDRCVGFLERCVPWEDAVDEDHLYDSMSSHLVY